MWAAWGDESIPLSFTQSEVTAVGRHCTPHTTDRALMMSQSKLGVYQSVAQYHC